MEEHLERFALCKELFPRHADGCALGAIAAMAIPGKRAAFAERAGLFVVGQSGEDAAARFC